MNLTGASRRLLTTIESRGICTPYRSDAGTGTLGWTANQVQMVGRICQMRSNGMSFDQIEAVIAEGDEAFERIALEAQMQIARQSRRNTKREAAVRRIQAQLAAVGERDGYYLRYLPERYYAVLPLDLDTFMRPADYTRTLMVLTDLASHLGWAPLGINGLIIGAPKLYDMACCAFVQLASAPMPQPTAVGDADSGCFREFGGACAFGGGGRSCELCARYGKPLTNADEIQWRDFAGTYDIEDHTVLLDEQERAYPCGPWSAVLREHVTSKGRTLEALAEQSMPGAASTSAISAAPGTASLPSVAAKPHLMPQKVKLPLGAMAAIMPAGWYLCRQSAGDRLDQALSEMVGTLRVIPHQDMTIDDEAKRALELQRLVGFLPPVGECLDVQGGFPEIGDPVQLSRWRPVSDRELSQLRVFTNAGLLEDSDFSMVCTTVPSGGVDDLPAYELQVFIDESMVEAAVNDKPARGLGFAAAFMRPFAKEQAVAGFRCRACGDLLPYEPARGVCVCKRCGIAQSVPMDAGGRFAELLLQADECRYAGRFDAAVQLCHLACGILPADASARWLRLLCRLGVRYVEDPTSGRWTPVMERPIAEPLAQDEDYLLASSLGSDVQWELFRRHGYGLEQARLAALGLGGYVLGIEARL